MQSASIFNDVIGPVMRGPSSSHTAGAHRIGQICRDLAGDPPRIVRCTFDPDGSYAATYRPLGVDQAFAAGFLGWEMTDPRYAEAKDMAARAGLRIEFAIDRLPGADHPNAVRVDMDLASGRTLSLRAKATGGGAVEMDRVSGFPVVVDGRSFCLLVEVDGPDAAEVRRQAREVFGRDAAPIRRSAGTGSLLQWTTRTPPPVGVVERLRLAAGVTGVYATRPVVAPQLGEPLFTSAREMLRIAAERDLTLGEVALRYEAQLLERPADQLLREMLARFAVMEASVRAGLDDASVRLSLIRPSASRLLEAERRGELALGGVHTRAAARAMATMHVCNSRGIVCAAPTGGSAGVLPGVLTTLQEERGLDETAIAKALFAAGAVGLIVAARATFAAEIAGCQVEIGVAGAMAAAAVVEIAGGTARQAADAAAIALQNTLGSVCDTVGGACEVPCHTRNAAAAANAFLNADLVLGGYENLIPLDETIDASHKVGLALPRELRCTSRGGLAVTPAARNRVRQIERT